MGLHRNTEMVGNGIKGTDDFIIRYAVVAGDVIAVPSLGTVYNLSDRNTFNIGAVICERREGSCRNRRQNHRIGSAKHHSRRQAGGYSVPAFFPATCYSIFFFFAQD